VKTNAELKAMLAWGPAAGSRWVHYKGREYTVVTSCVHEGTLTVYVVYRQDDTGMTFARPLAEWTENVLLDGPGGEVAPRFRRREG
jgi:hypothetical protein